MGSTSSVQPVIISQKYNVLVAQSLNLKNNGFASHYFKTQQGTNKDTAFTTLSLSSDPTENKTIIDNILSLPQ